MESERRTSLACTDSGETILHNYAFRDVTLVA